MPAATLPATLLPVQVVLSAALALLLEYRVVLHAYSAYLAYAATHPALCVALLTAAVAAALTAFWMAKWG